MCAYLRASLVERVRLFVVVVVVPGLLTPRNTLLEGGSLRVHLFSITPPHGQTHSDFRGFNFCLQKAHVCWVSVCFRTPRLLLGHPGSFKSAHGLKCMRTQTAPLFNVPRGRRGTTRVVHPIHA